MDFLARHEVMERLELLYQRCGNKVWLTEFAAVIEFVKEIWGREEVFF